MQTDFFSFVKRTQLVFKELRENKYPNAGTLATATGCSIATAKRTITRIEEEFSLPIKYDASKKGYYLTDPEFKFPDFLPAGKDELCSLLLARSLLQALDIGELSERIDSLWEQVCVQNKRIRHKLEPLLDFFTSDSTVVGDLADKDIFKYIESAASGESVRLVYRSPWRHKEEKTYEGRIAHVRHSDGHLYLGFVDKTERGIILNVSFIKSFEILPHSVGIDGAIDFQKYFKNWGDGFGVWAHEDLQTIKVRIRPPASSFYVSERWSSDQTDEWDGDVLVRSFPGAPSPEVARRILSIGGHVESVEPKELREEVVRQGRELVGRLG